jgi:hypothetical protein
MNMEQMILSARPHDLTPEIGIYNRWESSWICKQGFTNTFSAESPEDAVRMAYRALKGGK